MEVKEFISKLENYKEKLDISLIKEACIFASTAHKGQLRKSKKPYITHPINVAFELIQYSFDTHIIVASLLHDVLEDTEVTEDILKQKFGEDITSIVIGLTKLSKYNFVSQEEAKIENLRKFILSFIEDIRVLIIKIFDRLDNIRTIEYHENIETKKRIARETLDIYAPLAQRLAMNSIKNELEDKCFEVLHPEIRTTIIEKTKALEKISSSDVLKVKSYIINEFNDRGIDSFTIVSRIKQPYSIWRKMQKKHLNFEEIGDIVAFRIIVKNIEDCYTALGILHSSYKAIFSRFKDYISYPKPNNYRSLHTGVVIDNYKRLEFQIRTEEMDYFAEKGIASHWGYKNPVKTKYDISQYSWLQNLASIIQSKDLPIDYIYEYSKMQLFSDEVFAFTPQGDVISLQKGATALDFAYSIHSEIGHHCSSAIINGIYKPLFTVLKNGDKVEVVKDNNQEPQIYWLSFVKTPIAKISIRRYLNQKYKKEISQQAISLIEYVFQQEDLQFHKELIPKILEVLKIKSEQELYDKVLEGKINIYSIINILYPQQKIISKVEYTNVVQSESLEINSVCMADCCHPVYGDDIIAVVLPSSQVEIHHKSCKNLYLQFESLNKVKTKWLELNSLNKDYYYKVRVNVVLKNVIGSLMDITTICFKMGISILDIFISEYIYFEEGYKKFTIILLVKNKQQSDEIIKGLNSSPYVRKAERVIDK